MVATPGRARELIEADAMTLAHLERVVCDEADRMLDMGFLPQVEWVLSRAPEGRIKWLLSATLPKPVEDLVHTLLAKPRKIEAGERNRAAEHLSHQRMLVDEPLKTPALLSLLVTESLRRGIVVYCASRRRTGWVAGALRKHEVSVAVVHGDRSQLQREKALESFAHGRCRGDDQGPVFHRAVAGPGTLCRQDRHRHPVASLWGQPGELAAIDHGHMGSPIPVAEQFDRRPIGQSPMRDQKSPLR